MSESASNRFDPPSRRIPALRESRRLVFSLSLLGTRHSSTVTAGAEFARDDVLVERILDAVPSRVDLVRPEPDSVRDADALVRVRQVPATEQVAILRGGRSTRRRPVPARPSRSRNRVLLLAHLPRARRRPREAFDARCVRGEDPGLARVERRDQVQDGTSARRKDLNHFETDHDRELVSLSLSIFSSHVAEMY